MPRLRGVGEKPQGTPGGEPCSKSSALCHSVPCWLWPVPRARGPSGSRDNPSSPVVHSFKDMVSFTRLNPSVCEPVCRVSDEGEHGR